MKPLTTYKPDVYYYIFTFVGKLVVEVFVIIAVAVIQHRDCIDYLFLVKRDIFMASVLYIH